MKKIWMFTFCWMMLAARGQSDRFTQAMTRNISLMDSAKSTADLQALANTFERIGDAEKTQWLPYYYAGLCLARAGWNDAQLDKDANADRIKALCTKAETIEKNAEIYSLRNMAATQQMVVDPQNRWQTFGQEASQARQMGLQLDPNNPRLYYLQAMSIYNTPENYGGGKKNAKPLFEKAVALYQQEKPKPLYPTWGRPQAEEMLAKCQQP